MSLRDKLISFSQEAKIQQNKKFEDAALIAAKKGDKGFTISLEYKEQAINWACSEGLKYMQLLVDGELLLYIYWIEMYSQ